MPIVISKEELARIQRWTTEHEEPDMVRRREMIKYMDETSKAMTKTWPNSVENVNRRNEELRQARIQMAEQANTKFYKRYIKRKKEEQQRLMHSARDTVFKNKDAPKLLLSAVIETCIQKERSEQLKFLSERRREAAERKRKEDEDIIRKAREWQELMANKRHQKFQADKKYQKEILDQANEIAERNRMEYEAELNMQKLDNFKANQQTDALKEFETKFKADEKARIFRDMERAKHDAIERKKEQKARDKMDDRLMEVLIRSKARIEKKRLQTEKEIKAEKMKVLENISSKLESGEAARAAKEQEILHKAISDKEAIAEGLRKKQAVKEAEMKQERLALHQQWLEQEKQRVHEVDTLRQWDCMNRFKNIELFEDFQEKNREEKSRKIKEYREDMLRLWKERVDREARERAETRYFYGELAEKKIRDADKKLLAHAHELLQEARAHGRPEHALHKAVDHYCKMHRLYPLPGLPKSMQEHFQHYTPRDRSEPDPGYCVSSLLDRAPDVTNEGDESKRNQLKETEKIKEKEVITRNSKNGLQNPDKPSPKSAKPMVKEKKEAVDDYKRLNKANGLQRKNTEIELPSITATPCKHQICSCSHKK